MGFVLSRTDTEGEWGWVVYNYFADVEALGSEELEALPNFLCEEFLPRVRAELPDAPPDLHVKLFIRIGNNFSLPEIGIWRMVLDSFPNGEEHVKRYSQKITELFCEWGELPWTSGHEQLGAFALEVCFDRAIQNETLSQIDLELFDAYLGHVRLCDMDHEVRQHEYMKEIVSCLIYRDASRLQEWLWFRLSNGQQAEVDDDFQLPAIFVQGVFKYLIDKMLEEESWQWDFQRLCSLVYGKDLDAMLAVMEYVDASLAEKGKKREAANFPPPIDFFVKNEEFLASVEETYPNFEIDTGFHKLDRARRRWQLK